MRCFFIDRGYVIGDPYYYPDYGYYSYAYGDSATIR
jgi:hypothetical protein